MEKRKRTADSIVEQSIIRQKKDEIILNYGVEIEAVFELINVHTAYNQFINFYLNYKRFSSNNNRINSAIISFIKLLKICIDKHPDDVIIKQLLENEIYNSLIPEKTEEEKNQERERIQIEKQRKKSIKIKVPNFLAKFGVESSDSSSPIIDVIEDIYIYDDKKISEFLNTNLKLLIIESRKINDTDEISEEARIFIKKWQEFLNIAIKIIKDIFPDFNKKNKNIVETILNISNDMRNSVNIAFQKIFDLTENQKIKLYDISDIDTFFEKIQNTDEINLCLIEDLSVVCNDNIIYKNIKSGQIVKYNYLLNNCEFITQPFNTIDDVKNKLSIFFTNSIIDNTLLNCATTSQHVHISFNNSTGIIRPKIYLILCILCVSLHFQDEIFKLFLITRTDNTYCKKLNYNDTYSNKDSYVLDANYNTCLIKLCNIFNENPGHVISINTYEHECRYYWLNIINLFKFSINKPYTIEFRLKHGSTDAEELGNVCKLYENIINYANELLIDESLNIKGYTNIKEIKILIDQTIRDGGEDIFKQKILKDINYYFTNPNSEYVKGLKILNEIIEPKEEFKEGGIGGIKEYNQNMKQINSLFISLQKTPIYKINSFGYEYIGHGLSSNIQTRLKTVFIHKNKNITQDDLQQYLNLHNIYYHL